MLYNLIRFWKTKSPLLKGWIFKLLYKNNNIKIGKNFKCDSFPSVLLTQKGKLIIGDNVLLRRNVEIRSHQNSMIFIGNNSRIDRGVRLLATNKAKIHLSEGVRVGLYSVFNGGDNIFLGKKTLISGFVYLQTSMHRYAGEGFIQNQGYTHAPISLGEDAWVGTHAVLFPGVQLEAKVIVGSNAVVRGCFPANSIIGGIPAKLLKIR